MSTSLKTFWQKSSLHTRLWISTIGSGLIYLVFTLPFPLSRYYAVNPPVDYAKLTQHSIFGFSAYLVGIISLFGLYIVGLRSLAGGQATPRFVFFSSALFALVLLFSYPQTAIDMLVYALYSRGWGLYGLSPFSTSPAAFPAGDPWLGLAGEWANAASPYGPIWEWLSLGAFHLSGGGYLAHLFALKIISLLAYLGSAWLVYQILCLIRPQWAVAGMAFFAWNPLVLFESVQNAHNDIVMVFFLLIAIWAYARLMQGLTGWKYLLLSGVFILGFALSVLVKFVPLMILPFLLLGLALQQRSWLPRIGVISLNSLAIILLTVLMMAPYWPGVENWAVLQVSQGAGRSLYAFMVLTLKPQVDSIAKAFDYTSLLIYAVFGGIYLWELWQVIAASLKRFKGRADNSEAALETPLRASFYVFFWYTLLAATVFHAWYLLWFMPLAALLIPGVRTTSGALMVSLMALLIIPYYETIRVWIPYLNQNHWWGHLIGVSLLLVPVLFALWKPIPLFSDGKDSDF